MSPAQAAAGADRLPWLDDEPLPAAKRSNREAAGWGVAATVAVASVSYWMGAHSWPEPPMSEPAAETTVPLPQPRAADTAREAEPRQPQVAVGPQPEVTPVAQRPIPLARSEAEPERQTRSSGSSARSVSQPARTIPKPPPPPTIPVPALRTAKPAPVAANKPLTDWPAWQSSGASGRLVRIGAFGSRTQAKLGWRAMVRSYPAVAHLQATVVEARNSRGKRFYRFQIGTTSQAHSEVLCQRMQKIRFSCAVVGLPWKPGGVER